MPSNTAAWYPQDKVKPVEIRESTYTSPGEDEITIHNHAIAFNPADWVVQELGTSLFSHLKYPLIGGMDVAGEVVEIGKNVTRFKPGDRVLGMAIGILRDNPAQGGFQEYVVLKTENSSLIPDSMPFENAAVIPLGLFSSSMALFSKQYLGLQYPSISPKPTGKTLLVWGGASSVGSNAIQLAVAAGLEVITTCSPKNFEFVKKLGASKTFDYNSTTVIEDLVNVFQGKTSAGGFCAANGWNKTPDFQDAMTVMHDAVRSSGKVIGAVEGNKFLALANMAPQYMPDNVTHKFVVAAPEDLQAVLKAVYEDFLYPAMNIGKFVAAPDPLIVGEGIASVQAGHDLQKKGVSAKKVVIKL